MANSRQQKRRITNKKNSGYFDYTLLFVVLFLVCFGLIMIYSTSSYVGATRYNNPAYWFRRQAIFAVLGIIAMFIVSRIDYHIYQRFSILFYVVAIILQVIVLFQPATKGASRWIKLGPISFQPSEISKIALILFLAHVITLTANQIHKFKKMITIVALALPVFALVAVENMSTSIVILAVALIMVFVASPKYAQFIGIGGGAVGALVIVLLSASYRLERIQIWLHPEAHEKGFQTMQALYAIGSGGLFGKGLGQSMQKLGFIPEAYNDMIFSVICEELGLFGAICIIAMFVILLWRLLIISANAVDLYGSLIVVGVLAHIGVQVLINIAVVTNSIPPTGITLPFISSGGTSLFFVFVEMGLALAVARYIKLDH